MQIGALLLVLLGSNAFAANIDDQKNRPVSKVIGLLKDMVAQLEKEGEEDEEIYETMDCWCDTNEKEKTKAIADGKAKDEALTHAIEDFTANTARLAVEISNLENEVAKNSAALDKATALRKKELAEFNAEEKEFLQTISSVKSAVIALSKHHSASMVQQESSEGTMNFLEMIVGLQATVRKHADIMGEVFTPKQRKTMDAFLASPTDEHELALIQTSAPASGEIFGMLKQMKETFETNLANAQKTEAQSQADFEDLKAAKESEIAAGQELIDTKSSELAGADEKNAQNKQDLVDTRATLEADIKFLASVQETCQNVDQEYEERTKTRQLEIQAVSKALAFLSSDEAHDLFTRTFNPALVQKRSAISSKRRAQVAKVLESAAQRTQDPRLSTLAVQARLDAFSKVKASIQDMVEKLTKEKEDEIKHKDFCVEELNNNERDTEMKERDRSDLEAKIDDLAQQVDALSKEIEALKAEVAEMNVQMKRAGEDREKQNKEFQTVVADQRATQKLLTASLDILKGFYEKAALVQKSEATKSLAGQSPPPGFKSYEKNEKSGGVMGMMQGIIDDAKTMEAEAIRAEEDSQKDYEEFVKETNTSVDAKNKSIMNKSETKARAEADKVEAETEHEAVVGELETLNNENLDLHKSCDFTLKNFELRQTARGDEIEALKQALATFSGASFSAFLQRQ